MDESLFKKGVLLADYKIGPGVFGNLDLILPYQTYVSVPYQEPDTQQSPYRLRFLRGKYFLTTLSEPIQVELIPHPTFTQDLVKEGVKIGDVSSCHGSYVSLHLGAHRYLQSHLSTPSEPYRKELVLTVDEVIALIQRIKKDQPVDVVTLSAWDVTTDDGGILQIEPYIRAIKAAFNLLLFVEVHPPKSKSLIDVTYAMGADSVCYHLGNLCSHGQGDEPLADDSRMDEDLALLRYAVDVFPLGSVLSHITMGNRPLNDVAKDIETLSSIRVLPLLTAVTREVMLEKNLSLNDMGRLFGLVYEEAKRNKVPLNYFSRLAPFIAPMEGRFFSGDTPRLKLAMLNLYHSRLFGGSISAGLSNLRRKLRVREK